MQVSTIVLTHKRQWRKVGSHIGEVFSYRLIDNVPGADAVMPRFLNDGNFLTGGKWRGILIFNYLSRLSVTHTNTQHTIVQCVNYAYRLQTINHPLININLEIHSYICIFHLSV